MNKLRELAQEAVYELRHLSTDSEHGLAADLQIALDADRDSIAQVTEFELACGATLYPLSEQPPVEKLKLRLSLELEELYEKAQAMGLEETFGGMLLSKSGALESWSNPEWPTKRDTHVYDRVALLDACCDQRYVQDGTMLTCGLDKVFSEAFTEVHRSNMSKFCETADVADATEKAYLEKGIETTVRVHDAEGKLAKWVGVVRRKSDGKILKSINYSPPDLESVLAKYTA